MCAPLTKEKTTERMRRSRGRVKVINNQNTDDQRCYKLYIATDPVVGRLKAIYV